MVGAVGSRHEFKSSRVVSQVRPHNFVRASRVTFFSRPFSRPAHGATPTLSYQFGFVSGIYIDATTGALNSCNVVPPTTTLTLRQAALCIRKLGLGRPKSPRRRKARLNAQTQYTRECDNNGSELFYFNTYIIKSNCF